MIDMCQRATSAIRNSHYQFQGNTPIRVEFRSAAAAHSNTLRNAGLQFKNQT